MASRKVRPSALGWQEALFEAQAATGLLEAARDVPLGVTRDVMLLEATSRLLAAAAAAGSGPSAVAVSAGVFGESLDGLREVLNRLREAPGGSVLGVALGVPGSLDGRAGVVDGAAVHDDSSAVPAQVLDTPGADERIVEARADSDPSSAGLAVGGAPGSGGDAAARAEVAQ